jgi:hypothetical protein
VDTLSYLLIFLVLAATALCAVAVWAFVELARTMRSTRSLADDLDERVVPLLDKLDVTVDAVNAEILRIDGIVTTFEEVSDRVSTTTAAVNDVVNAPMDAVNAVGTRLRAAWKTSRSQKR